MKHLLLGAVLLFCVTSADAQIALVNHGAFFGSNRMLTQTTAPINMTGANLLVVTAAGNINDTSLPPDPDPSASVSLTVNDSLGNTWKPLPASISAYSSMTVEQIFYAFNAKVGTAQTFTTAEGGADAGGYVELEVLGFSGAMSASDPVDAHSEHVTPAPTTCVPCAMSGQPGSISPSQSGEVFVTASSNNTGDLTSMTVDGGFTITDNTLSSNNELGGAAYLVNAGVSPLNPTWTFNNNKYRGVNVVMASFKPANGSPPPSNPDGVFNSVTIPPQKSMTGQRYACVDTTGKIVSSTMPCSGT